MFLIIASPTSGIWSSHRGGGGDRAKWEVVVVVGEGRAEQRVLIPGGMGKLRPRNGTIWSSGRQQWSLHISHSLRCSQHPPAPERYDKTQDLLSPDCLKEGLHLSSVHRATLQHTLGNIQEVRWSSWSFLKSRIPLVTWKGEEQLPGVTMAILGAGGLLESQGTPRVPSHHFVSLVAVVQNGGGINLAHSRVSLALSPETLPF